MNTVTICEESLLICRRLAEEQLVKLWITDLGLNSELERPHEEEGQGPRDVEQAEVVGLRAGEDEAGEEEDDHGHVLVGGEADHVPLAQVRVDVHQRYREVDHA